MKLSINSETLFELPSQVNTRNSKIDKPKKLGNRRVTGKEQYYTPAATASLILENIRKLIPDLVDHFFLEPAGGTGSFIEAAKTVGMTKFVSYDIEPHHPLVQKGNFLEQKLKLKGAITVSNPPFGRCNSLSVPFFNKCAEYSDLIVFIVPRSWRKWSVQNKLDRRFHLIQDDDLDINYVDVNGEHRYKKNNLRTCIQYWKMSRDRLRPLYAVEDLGVIQKCRYEEADVALTIFGYSCGMVKTDFQRKSNTTSMFLKLKHPLALEALQSVDYSKFYLNTAYTAALSISEINYLLNEYLFGDPKLIEKQSNQITIDE
jgi:hypothetical protein